MTYEDCITGQTQSGPGGTGACAQIPSATSGGANSGLDGAISIGLSSDGRSLYAAAATDSAVARFDRDPDTGELAYEDCITGETQSGPGGSGACAEIPSATSGGANSGLDQPVSVTASADDSSLYVAASDDESVARFDRDPDTGELAYEDCITGETQSGPGGSGACTEIPSAAGGANSGLDGVNSLAVSADDRSLYTAAANDDAVARFDRDPDTGELAYEDCITGETQSGAGGSGACAGIPSATSGGAGSGLDNPQSVAASGDDGSLYAASGSDDAVAHFDRNPDTGELTYANCISGETESGSGGSGACAQIPSASSGGASSGLGSPQSIAVSADGGSLYAIAQSDDAVARFDRQATPQTTIDTGPATTTSDPTPTITFSSDTSGSTFECEVDFGAWVSCASPFTAFALADGPHRIQARATDYAGNVDPTPASADFTVDTSEPEPSPQPEPDTAAPDTELTRKPTDVVKSKRRRANLSFGFESSEPGSTFLCSLDGSEYFGCDSPYDATVKAKKKAKPHAFKVRAVDAAGNVDFSAAKWKGQVKRKKRKR